MTTEAEGRRWSSSQRLLLLDWPQQSCMMPFFLSMMVISLIGHSLLLFSFDDDIILSLMSEETPLLWCPFIFWPQSIFFRLFDCLTHTVGCFLLNLSLLSYIWQFISCHFLCIYLTFSSQERRKIANPTAESNGSWSWSSSRSTSKGHRSWRRTEVCSSSQRSLSNYYGLPGCSAVEIPSDSSIYFGREKLHNHLPGSCWVDKCLLWILFFSYSKTVENVLKHKTVVVVFHVFLSWLLTHKITVLFIVSVH